MSGVQTIAVSVHAGCGHNKPLSVQDAELHSMTNAAEHLEGSSSCAASEGSAALADMSMLMSLSCPDVMGAASREGRPLPYAKLALVLPGIATDCCTLAGRCHTNPGA